MNHAQKYLAQANRQIAELAVQLARQRVIVKHALDTGQRSEMAESLLNALEESLRIFEKHRSFLLSFSVNRPSKNHSSHLISGPSSMGPEPETRVPLFQR
jgi:N-acyl-D-aspartate/D-glutamate deacylase